MVSKPIAIFHAGHGKSSLVWPGAVSVTDIFAVEIGGVLWAWQRSRILQILQTYFRHIADILPQIAADCGRLRWKTVDCDGRCHGVCPVILRVDSRYHS